MQIIKSDCADGIDAQCEDAILTAVEDLHLGNLVVYPTETVYGIGADIYNQVAVKNLFLAKKRPFDMALSVAVSDKKMMEQVAVLNENADKLIKEFLPGPLTIIIEKQQDVSDLVTASSNKVGIRIPDHPIARELARRNGPIIATSANLHSHPDAVNINMAIDDLGTAVSTYLDAGPSPSGKPSTIVWLNKDEFEIIRQGIITKEQIEKALQC